MATLIRDIQSASRRIASQPSFAAMAIVTLAVGIGANAAMFNVVNTLMIRPLPHPEPERLVRVGETFPWNPRPTMSNQVLPLIEDADAFEAIGAHRQTTRNWTGPHGTGTLTAGSITPSMLDVLRPTPLLGRLFTEREAASRVVLLSHRTWTTRFAADPNVLDIPVELDGEAYEVAGVMERDFHFPTPETEVWTPFSVSPFNIRVPVPGAGASSIHTFDGVARLAPGVTAEQAAVEVRTRVEAGAAFRVPGSETRVEPLLEEMVGEYRPALAALSAAAALIMLIACTNIASLTLSRGMDRRRNMAVSAALGATRWCLVRELLTENTMLGAAGGLLGLWGASAILRAAPAVIPGNIARLNELGIDGETAAFTVGLSIAAGLTVGAGPAFQWLRTDIAQAMKQGGGSARRRFPLKRPRTLRGVLAAGQLAIAVMLLVGAGLLLRTFIEHATIDRGFDPADVFTMPVTLDARGEDDGVAGPALINLLAGELARIESLADIEAAGVSTAIPLSPARRIVRSTFHDAGGKSPRNYMEFAEAPINFVTPRYAETMRLRIQGGRFFTANDRMGAPPAIVLSETLARLIFGDGPYLGRRVDAAVGGDEPWEVVGVVDDIRHQGERFTESEATAYIPLDQLVYADGIPGTVTRATLSVRTAGDQAAYAGFIREAVQKQSPNTTVHALSAMEDRLRAAVAEPRFYAGAAAAFAGLAALLAALGVYALLTETLSDRRQEIGVRMALGATPREAASLIVRQGAGLAAVGTLTGIAGAAGAARVLEHFLFGVHVRDTLTFAIAATVLSGTAVAAAWLPARRASSIDPMTALRTE